MNGCRPRGASRGVRGAGPRQAHLRLFPAARRLRRLGGAAHRGEHGEGGGGDPAGRGGGDRAAFGLRRRPPLLLDPARRGRRRGGATEGARRRPAIPSSISSLTDPCDLGGQCFFWEMATAVAGWRLAINPFDQPDVEAAKILARKMIAEYREKGAMPPETPSLKAAGLSVYGDRSGGDAGGRPGGVSGTGEAGRVCRAPGLSAALRRDRTRPCSASGCGSGTVSIWSRPSATGPASSTRRASSTRGTPGAACSSSSRRTIPGMRRSPMNSGGRNPRSPSAS